MQRTESFKGSSLFLVGAAHTLSLPLTHTPKSGVVGVLRLFSYYIGRHNWRDTKEYERMQRTESFKGRSLFLVGAAHTLSNVKNTGFDMQEAYPAFKYNTIVSKTGDQC
jgi:hypothetical protein